MNRHQSSGLGLSLAQPWTNITICNFTCIAKFQILHRRPRSLLTRTLLEDEIIAIIIPATIFKNLFEPVVLARLYPRLIHGIFPLSLRCLYVPAGWVLLGESNAMHYELNAAVVLMFIFILGCNVRKGIRTRITNRRKGTKNRVSATRTTRKMRYHNAEK